MRRKVGILLIILVIIIILTIVFIKQNTNIKKFYLDESLYNEGKYIEINHNDLSKYNNYILFTNNNYCIFSKPCEEVFLEYMKKYKIDILSMKFIEFKKTSLYKKVKYAPSIIIIKQGKVIDYLDANNNDDLDKYQEPSKFEEWLNNYIYPKK